MVKLFTKRNEGFICENCLREVVPTANDTYRNHCPFCLHSKHVDINPGDRENSCQGLLIPVGLEIAGNDYKILFRCQKCGEITKNKMALKTPVDPDNLELIIEISKNPQKLF